ncbi:hypothetical protein F4677DRAFT_401745 [Hypoxylon crocopeplum]|nr:hypothetical protein F4677DRAFT_401745 [Hypoxylon crocopeplum]
MLLSNMHRGWKLVVALLVPTLVALSLLSRSWTLSIIAVRVLRGGVFLYESHSEMNQPRVIYSMPSMGFYLRRTCRRTELGLMCMYV